MGASYVRVALIAADGAIVYTAKEETKKEGKNGTVVTRQIIRMIHRMRAAQKHRIQKIVGIGVSSFGPLNYDRGGPEHGPNVPFEFIPLAGPMEKEFSLPVRLLNDGNAAVLGEQRFGAGRGLDNLVYVTLSTGIGGGAIVNGTLLLGQEGNATEVGHFIVDTEYRLPCTCGKGIGHWEAYASGRNIPRFFKHWAGMRHKKSEKQFQTAKDIFAAGGSHDPLAASFLDELSKINARAVSSVIAAYNPRLITFGGSVSLANRHVIVEGLKKYVDRFLKLPLMKITPLGEDAALLGAAASIAGF